MICYCDDCQTFARHLDKAHVLDAYGGLDVVQVAPPQLRLAAGTSELRCLRLSPKGAHRWYARCCQQPLANTPGPGWPFIGMIGASLENVDAVGPPAAKIQGRFSDGSPDAHANLPLGFVAKSLVSLGTDKLRGRVRPSPFYRGRVPVSTLETLTREQRRAAYPPHLSNPH